MTKVVINTMKGKEPFAMEEMSFLKGSERIFLYEDMTFPLRPEGHTEVNRAERNSMSAEGRKELEELQELRGGAGLQKGG